MRYFTPDLIARGQSQEDEVLNEVEAHWDELSETFQASLAAVREELPRGLLHLMESYYLHDATIQGMGRRDGAFVIVLQLDTPPHSLLTFTYDLVEEPRVDCEALPAAARSLGGAVEWQYDEVEMVGGNPATWRQSILLSNGWEVDLHFRDVGVEEVQALLPARRNGTAMSPADELAPTA